MKNLLLTLPFLLFSQNSSSAVYTCGRAISISENFEFVWAEPTQGEIEKIIFDSENGEVSVLIQEDGPHTSSQSWSYEFHRPSHVGERGRFSFGNGELVFPVTPLARIKGKRPEYFIAEQENIYLCPKSLGKEMKVTK